MFGSVNRLTTTNLVLDFILLPEKTVEKLAIDRENAIELQIESRDIECQIATLKTAGGKLVPTSGGASEPVDFYGETKCYADK